MTKLQDLYTDGGQSPWLDNLKRSYLTGGELHRQIQRGIRGLTSNPTIFQKAIQGSADYDDQFRALVRAGGTVTDHYWELVLADIHGALDQFDIGQVAAAPILVARARDARRGARDGGHFGERLGEGGSRDIHGAALYWRGAPA